MSEFIRVWKNVSVEDVTEHLLIVGIATGDCSRCRQLGIDYVLSKTCPKCGTDFRYIASRSGEIKKIKEKRPDLIFIDFGDYKNVTGRKKAKDLFSFGGK